MILCLTKQIGCSESFIMLYIFVLLFDANGINHQRQLQVYFLVGSIRNINYTKFKTKKNLNISISPKNKKKEKRKIEIIKVLQLLSMIFHILKLWGQRTYDPTHALLGPKARAEEGICRGRIGKGRNAWGHSRG